MLVCPKMKIEILYHITKIKVKQYMDKRKKEVVRINNTQYIKKKQR